MPLELLKKLAKGTLPRSFVQPSDIDLVQVCKAAGYIDASIPPAMRGGFSYAEGAAIVSRIRPLGYEALTKYIREQTRPAGPSRDG